MAISQHFSQHGFFATSASRTQEPQPWDQIKTKPGKGEPANTEDAGNVRITSLIQQLADQELSLTHCRDLK